MTDSTSLLDDGWSYGRKNFPSLTSSNSVSPSLIDKRDNTRSDWRTAPYNSGLSHGMATGMGILGQVNAYYAQKAETEKAINAMHGVKVADAIRDQLAPGQEVRLLVNLDTGSIKLIRAGDGYISDTLRKPFEIRRTGSDGGICRGDEVPEVTRFLVTNRKGEKEWLVLEDGPRQSAREEKERATKERDLEVPSRRNRKQREEP